MKKRKHRKKQQAYIKYQFCIIPYIWTKFKSINTSEQNINYNNSLILSNIQSLNETDKFYYYLKIALNKQFLLKRILSKISNNQDKNFNYLQLSYSHKKKNNISQLKLNSYYYTIVLNKYEYNPQGYWNTFSTTIFESLEDICSRIHIPLDIYIQQAQKYNAIIYNNPFFNLYDNTISINQQEPSPTTVCLWDSKIAARKFLKSYLSTILFLNELI